MAIYSIIHGKWFETEDERRQDQESLMHVIECENEPNHACCAYNDCDECAPAWMGDLV
jgi:hypothetical protein